MDNEEDILALVKRILEKEGYEVTGVTTGKGAVEKVKAGSYDLILLDIMVPDLSGWDVFTRVRKINAGQKVVFLTALEISQERKKQLEEYGIADYILKPLNLNDFVKRVKAAIGD